MKFSIKYIPTILSLLAVLIFIGCNKLVSVDPPEDRVSRDIVFTNDATAIAAISGLYTQMIRTNFNLASGGTTFYTALSADEIYNSTVSANIDEFTNNALTASNSSLKSNLWAPAYNYIFQANNIIEGLQNSTGVSSATATQLIGEAKFIRAFCHFYLVNLFGDVPLILTTEYKTNAILPRTPVAQVYAQVIADLKDAENLLPTTYPSASRARPNKYTAQSLLARAYLYQGDWINAETESNGVITSGIYTLTTNLANTFLNASNETIWQLIPTSTSVNTWDGNNFIPATAVIPPYPLTSTLLNTFSATDLRKTNWARSVTVGTNTLWYPYKYKIKTATSLTEYYIIFRLAEQYLIRAEARTQQNKIALAQSDLNAIRTKAGLANTTASDQPSLLLAIEKERQLEFFTEWGHRWFDLKRTNRINTVLSAKPGWSSTDALYPIPLAEMQRNTALTQNPGY